MTLTLTIPTESPMSHTSNDLMEMMTALEEAGIKKPAHFLGLLHERGYHVAKNAGVPEMEIPQFLRRAQEDAGIISRAAE